MPCPVSSSIFNWKVVSDVRIIAANGPAIKLVSVTRRQHRVASRYPAPAGPQNCHGARRVWRGFWHPGTNFYEDYACRGTKLIEARKLSRYRIKFGSTGVVSRHKFDRSQKTITVHKVYCGQRRVSGYNNRQQSY